MISTYQSVSGIGVKAVQQLENEVRGIKGDMAYIVLFMKCNSAV